MFTPEFPNADHVAAANADLLFRTLAHHEDEFTGDVTTVGWAVTKVYADRFSIAGFASAYGDPWVTEARNVAPGYYLVKVNSDGIVWAMHYTDKALWESDYDAIDSHATGWTDEILVDYDENGNVL